MQRLSGEDAGFLYLELPTQPVNSMGLALLSPPAADGGGSGAITLRALRGHVARRLDVLPSFRWRVRRAPLGLSHPVFVDDASFDLDFHLRETTVAAPGTIAEVDALMASLAQRHLDQRHPLWQLTLVHGLEGGRQALIMRYHHSIADGVGAFTTYSRLFSDEPEPGTGPGPGPSPAVEPAPAWRPEVSPRGTRLLVDAIADQARIWRGVPELGARTIRNLSAFKRHLDRSPVTVPKPLVDTPVCSLNDAYTLGRTYCRAGLAMADVKFVKDVAGVSLNDVALAVVGGALARYLETRADLPARPLTVSVPVAIEPPDAPPRQWGNRFANLTSTLATDDADPWRRLHTISTVTAEAKAGFEVMGPTLLPEWLDVFPQLVAAPAVRARHRHADRHRRRADVSVLVSNVRGPRGTWYLGRTAIDELYLQGPPTSGVGSNVLVWSYGDRLNFSVLSFADALGAPAELAAALHAALDELVALAVTHQREPVAAD